MDLLKVIIEIQQFGASHPSQDPTLEEHHDAVPTALFLKFTQDETVFAVEPRCSGLGSAMSGIGSGLVH